MTTAKDTDMTDEKKALLEECNRPQGVKELEAGRFAYYPVKTISYDGAKIDFLQLRQPNLRQMKAAKLSVGEVMNAHQMENMIFACVERVIDADGGEVLSANKRKVLCELFCGDVTALTAECSKRFFDTTTD